MTDTDAPSVQTHGLSERVAEELRALLARRRMSGRDLARLLGTSPSWVSYRLTGTTKIDLDDLERIAIVLDMDPIGILRSAAQEYDRDRERRNEIVAANPPSNGRWHDSLDGASGAQPIGQHSKARNGHQPQTGDQAPRRPVRLTSPVTA